MKSILIFGVGKGFGLSIAKQFGKDNEVPIMVARNENNLIHFKTQLHQKGYKINLFYC